jgi:hypothetical protein
VAALTVTISAQGPTGVLERAAKDAIARGETHAKIFTGIEDDVVILSSRQNAGTVQCYFPEAAHVFLKSTIEACSRI